MNNNSQAVVEIILRGQQPNATLRDLERSARALRSQLNRLPMDSQEFVNRSRELAQVNTRLRNIRNDLSGLGGMFQSIGREIKALGIIGGAVLAFTWLTGKISSIVKGNSELSDSLADIQKTTGMTEAEVKKLNTTLGQINTRTATKELRNIAIVGGQLGIAKNDILKFTVAVDKMNVALGDEFTGGAAEVTKSMGGLRNIFTDIKTAKVDEDMLHIGNAINLLASTGAATGPVIADFSNRIGGVGITLGLTSGQVLGLSATLQELNVNTERGGTAVTRILQKMTTNTKEFANVADMPIREFTKLVNTDLYGAFIKVVEGSRKSGTSATAFAKILDSLGVDGAGASEVFAKLGSNTEKLSEKVLMANNALKNTDSIMAEFNTKNSTLGAEMDRLSKGMASAFTNSPVSDGLKWIVSGLADLFDKTKKASEGMEEERMSANLLVLELTTANTTNARRKEIYDELFAINAKLVEGLDKENISVSRLNDNLKAYNELAINKIIIQKEQEKIDDQTEIAAEKAQKMLKEEDIARRTIAATVQKQGAWTAQVSQISNDGSLTYLQKLQQINKVLTDIAFKNGKTVNWDAKDMLQGISYVTSRLAYSTDEYNEELNKNMDLINDKFSLEKKLFGEQKKIIDYTKLTEAELNHIIKQNTDSRNVYLVEEAKAAKLELLKRQKEKSAGIIAIDEEEMKKLIENHKRMLDELAKLEQEHRLAKMPKDQREMEEIKLKYDKLRSAALVSKKDLERIQSLQDDDTMNLIMKNFEDQTKVETQEYSDKLKRLKNLKSEKEKIEQDNGIGSKNMTLSQREAEETKKLSQEWDKRIQEATDFNNSLYQGEEEFFINVEDLTRAKYEALENLSKAHNLKLSETERQANQEMLRSIEKVWDSISTIGSSFNSIQANEAEREVRQDEKRNNTKKAQYKRMLDAKLISQKQYDQKVAAIDIAQDEKATEIKRKQANKEKRAAIIGATINTALAVSKANSAAVPPLNYLLMALAAAAGALQIGAIASAPIAYAKGGTTTRNLFKSGGKVEQPHLAMAGEAGPEWIAPNWMLQDPITANVIQSMEAIRLRGYANGGVTSNAVTTTIPPKYETSNSTGAASYSNDFSGLASSIDRLNFNLENGIIAKLYYDDFTKSLGKIDSARNSARIG